MKKNSENQAKRMPRLNTAKQRAGEEKSLLNSKIAKSNSKLNRKSNHNQHKGLIIIALLILLVISLIFIIIFKMPDQPQLPNSEDSASIELAEFEEIMTFQNNEGLRYYPFESQLVYFSQDKIELMDMNGQVLYDQNVEFTRPVAVYNEDYFIAGDRDSNELIFLNHQGKQFSLQLDGTFAGAYFGENKYVAIIEENKDKPGFVHVIDFASGKILLTLQFFESGYPIAACFSHDLTTFDVLLSNTSGSVIQPVLNRYDLSGKQIGQILPTGQPFLFGKILHDQENHIILGGSSNLVALDFETGKTIAEFNAGKVYQVTSGPNITGLVSNRIEGEITAVDWDSSEKTFIDKNVALLDHIDEFACHNNLIAISQNNQIQVLNQDTEEIVLDSMVDARILRIGLLDHSLLLITDNGIKAISY